MKSLLIMSILLSSICVYAKEYTIKNPVFPGTKINFADPQGKTGGFWQVAFDPVYSDNGICKAMGYISAKAYSIQSKPAYATPILVNDEGYPIILTGNRYISKITCVDKQKRFKKYLKEISTLVNVIKNPTHTRFGYKYSAKVDMDNEYFIENSICQQIGYSLGLTNSLRRTFFDQVYPFAKKGKALKVTESGVEAELSEQNSFVNKVICLSR